MKKILFFFALAIFLFFVFDYTEKSDFQNQHQNSTQKDTRNNIGDEQDIKKPFQLDDSEAEYTITKLNDKYLVNYTKNAITESLYISSSKVDLSQFLDQSLIIDGVFVEKTMQVQCFKAPCDPVQEVQLEVKSVSLKNELLVR